MERNNNGYHSNTGGRQRRRAQAVRPKERKPNGKKRLWIVIMAAAAAAVCIILAAALPMSQPAPRPVHVTTETASVSTPVPSAAPTGKKMLPAMQTLYEQNSDIAGWITIEGTEVDYPVMYTPEDGEYYLYRNFEKEDDPTKEGCLFIDKNCTVEPRSTNLLIHGHNMKNGTMFHTLISYQDEAFYKEHPTIRYSTLYEEEEYEIAAVFLSKIYKKSETDVFKFYQFYDAETEEEFDEFVRSIKEQELYETGVTPEYGDELITLTTCEYSQENGRMVVVARKAEKEAQAAGTAAG